MKIRSKGEKADFTATAASVVSRATGQDFFTGEPLPPEEIETEAQKKGRLGGLVGGKARAKVLIAKERQRIARKAAKVRSKSTQISRSLKAKIKRRA